MTACFWIEPTGDTEVTQRRYSEGTCSDGGYCTAHAVVGITIERRGDDGYIEVIPIEPYLDNGLWPTHCETCGREFTDADERVVNGDTIYIRPDTREAMSLRNWGPGAMWDAWWIPWKGADGKCLAVKLPPDGHEWIIDSRASNCTLPDDREHRCWVRHGEPPMLTVDKDGLTCAAGGGSIQTPKWHGFLRNGELVSV